MIQNRKTVICGCILLAVLAAFVGCKKDGVQSERRQEKITVSLDGTSTFAAGVKIQAGGQAIDVKVGHLVPCAVDWNNDGKKDLVVGQFDQGSIRLYLNSGTDTEPVFQDSSLLQAGDSPIKLDAG